MSDELKRLWAEWEQWNKKFGDIPREEIRAHWDFGPHGGILSERVQAAFDKMAELTESIRPLTKDFEADLKRAFPKLEDDSLAHRLYAALCNVDWRHENGSRYSCSWRAAGGIVADLREQGENHMDFYCGGGEGRVDERISEPLEALGWRPITYDP